MAVASAGNSMVTSGARICRKLPMLSRAGSDTVMPCGGSDGSASTTICTLSAVRSTGNSKANGATSTMTVRSVTSRSSANAAACSGASSTTKVRLFRLWQPASSNTESP